MIYDLRFTKHILYGLTFSFVCLPLFVNAQGYISVTPAVIDQKALARDIIQETITVTNLSGARLDVYASVNNLDAAEGEQEFKSRADVVLGESLANWIEVSRGVIELAPGESTDLPVTIRVNLNAKAGNYHALIHFGFGSTRADAERRIKDGAFIAVNVEVVEDVKERLQLETFASNEIFFSGPQISFNYELENTGNRDLLPTGEVRIYDRRGREVGSVAANIEGTVIKPDETGLIASAWDAGKHFGRYKALLDLEYGNSQTGTVNDTIFFWIIPWKLITAVFIVLASVVGGGTYMLYNRYEERHGLAYARQGVPKKQKITDSLSIPLHSTAGDRPIQVSEHVMDMRN